MAKTFLQEADLVTVVAPVGGTTAGVGILIGDNLFGVALDTVLAGAKVQIAVKGVWTMAKEAVAFAPGATVFWNAANKTVDDASAKAVGFALNTVAGGVATVQVRLVPDTRASVNV
jgi:predicted RecA/RadA family phage recombinase